ncbi:TolC family protein [Frateuria sp. Soil773]|uniref:TolC family protein n=1 Tax=Frateuria sp. Soil773 TaxID=1736407 RepID=UPI0009ECC29F|nr:TolC family protein [Frateuria sp. Soil773]
MVRKAALFLLSAATLAGCAAAPAVPPRATISLANDVSPRGAPSPVPPSSWWQLYRDADLDTAVREALADNRDLRVAAARLLQAHAVLSETRGQLAPQTSITAGAGVGSTLQDQLVAINDRSRHIRTGPRIDLGGGVSWEWDLFGRLGSEIRNANAELRASAATVDGVRVAVAAGVTGAWLDACGYGHGLEVARNSLALAEHSRDLSQKILDAGAGTPIDVLRADALVAQQQAAIPPLEAGRRNALAELAVLTGHPPEPFASPAAACTTLPTIAAAVPTGDTTAMLRRRPDVREAEQRLAASTARIGVAVADLYPRISIGASAADSSPALGDLGSRRNVVWRFGPLLNWSFPNLAAARARVRQARAGEAAELASFDAVILKALKEVNQTGDVYRAVLERQAALTTAARRSALAAGRVAIQRSAGGATALELLDAQRTSLDAQAALAQADLDVARAQIALFKALGGGWEQAPPVDLPEPDASRPPSSLTLSAK